MVHVSELSSQSVDDPHDVVAVGQPVQALAHRSNEPAKSENDSTREPERSSCPSLFAGHRHLRRCQPPPPWPEPQGGAHRAPTAAARASAATTSGRGQDFGRRRRQQYVWQHEGGAPKRQRAGRSRFGCQASAGRLRGRHVTCRQAAFSAWEAEARPHGRWHQLDAWWWHKPGVADRSG